MTGENQAPWARHIIAQHLAEGGVLGTVERNAEPLGGGTVLTQTLKDVSLTLFNRVRRIVSVLNAPAAASLRQDFFMHRAPKGAVRRPNRPSAVCLKRRHLKF